MQIPMTFFFINNMGFYGLLLLGWDGSEFMISSILALLGGEIGVWTSYIVSEMNTSSGLWP
jgi:hypothetical protein